jgi:hypothetical protein
MIMMACKFFRMKQCWQVPAIAFLWLSTCVPAPLYAFDFGQWDAILKKNTRPSNHQGIAYIGFDYAAILKSNEFDRLVGALETFSPEQLQGEEEVLAFWINVYNIFAVKLVRDHYPVTSIKDVGSFIFPVWGMPAGKIGGKIYSLDDIEHKILRPMNEPAVHFAIVCASVSCPDLRAEAYKAPALKDQLRLQTARFLENRGKGVRVNRERKTVYLSRLFDWYEKDFAAAGGAVGFLSSEWRGNLSIPADYVIEFMTYNWDLNSVR